MCCNASQESLGLRIFIQKERIGFNDSISVAHNLRRSRGRAVRLDRNYLLNRALSPGVVQETKRDQRSHRESRKKRENAATQGDWPGEPLRGKRLRHESDGGT